jgi:hypothetical protein
MFIPSQVITPIGKFHHRHLKSCSKYLNSQGHAFPHGGARITSGRENKSLLAAASLLHDGRKLELKKNNNNNNLEGNVGYPAFLLQGNEEQQQGRNATNAPIKPPASSFDDV